ncbi:MAG TPA: ribosome silencing factor [Niabella sp.]|nr:ribosome silencing factor [Niabella sp.]
MEPLVSLTKRRNIASVKLTKKSKLFKTIIAAIQEKKGENIVSLDLRKIPEAVADFFIVCEATSGPQIKAIADNVVDKVKEICGENVFHKEGFQNLQWVLIDFVNIVVHVMHPEMRKFYNLEEMWSDAAAEEHQ